MNRDSFCQLCGKPFDRHTNGRIKPCNCREEKEALMQRGLRALDAVKHCQYDMKPHMKENDAAMRYTVPIHWTKEQIFIAELTDQWINKKEP